MTSISTQGYRLSPEQRRLWSVTRGVAGGPASSWCVLRIDGPVDAAALRRTADRLVGKHEILRTTFHRRPGVRVPFQVVSDSGAPDWRETDLPGELGEDPALAARSLVERELGFPLDLENGPALRLRLARLSGSAHLLLFALPSLCADRATLHAIARRLAGFHSGGEPDAGDPPVQYADYAQWQNELLEADDEPAREARAYWAEKPAEGAGSLPFEAIAEWPDPAGVSEFALSAALVERLGSFCREREISIADFLLACWQTLLWRTTGESPIVVGDVHPGRKFDELRDALGVFARALPVAARFEEDPAFSELARSAAEARSQNAEWQEYYVRPEHLGSDATSSRWAGFEFFERPVLPRSQDVSFSILRESAAVDAFPIRLECESAADSIRVRCETNAEISAAVARRVARHLEPLVRAAAGAPSRRAGELSMLDSDERRRLVFDWNSTAAEFPRSRCIHELFEERVGKAPDAPALVFERERWSYAALNARANALAWRLRERGVGPGVRVGLALERSAEMILALLGILKAGGAYVPLNPDHPGARLILQLDQSACRLVLTESGCLDKLASFSGEKISLDRDRSVPGSAETRNPPAAAAPGDLAYVLYTSGSTGVPKGVEVRHESLVNYACFVTRLLGADAESAAPLSFATVSTISADLGNTAIFPSLISGGCLHVIGYETAMEGGLFARYLSENPIDVLKIVPSHLTALLSSGVGREVLPRRALVMGGEALSWDLVDRVRKLGGDCEIVNHYGPTETTVGSLTFLVPENGAPKGRTVPIGRPIANTEVFLLDAAREPVPVGVAGELYIGGSGVARGYCNIPEETAERFVASPFSSAAGARLYRTGDRARYLPDGNVEFLGRMDDQVKIRGFRIEPGEVRAVLSRHPDVRESEVLAREDSPGERRLVAYVIPQRGAELAEDALRGWLKRQLPDYMVPSAFVTMKSFPLTPNGKLDRGALPPPEEARGDRVYVEPRTASEKLVAEIWAEVLRVPRVGAEDNFFDLGGHSLLLTQVVSRMRKAFRRELPIRWLFESPTVAGLAARADDAEREDVARILDELESMPEKNPDGVEIGNEPPLPA